MALFASINASHAGDSFTTDKVLASSVVPSLECLDYCFIGVCLYVKCTPAGCFVESTPWIEHRLPDLVVSAYNHPGEITWLEGRELYGNASATLLEEILGALTGLDTIGGGRSTNINKSLKASDDGRMQKADMLRFKEASVIGNPFANELSAIFSEYLCTSEVKPLKGYFQSEVDGFVWRYQIPEMLYRATWVPRMRHLGDRAIGNEWGGIHPRHGFLYSKDDMEVAAVASARAVDIVTREEQPHLYFPVEEIYESDEVIDKWSMIYPNFEPGMCDVFGGINYSIDRQSYFGGYGWMYWGRHECCMNADGPVIQKIKTEAVCLD